MDEVTSPFDSMRLREMHEWRGLNDVFVSGKALAAGIGSAFARFTDG